MNPIRISEAVALIERAAAILQEEEASAYEKVKAFPERRFRDVLPPEERATRDYWWSCNFYREQYLGTAAAELTKLHPVAPPPRVRVRPLPPAPPASPPVNPVATPTTSPAPVRVRTRPATTKATA